MQVEVRLGLPTVPYFGLIVPRPGLSLPWTPNVPFFGHAQIALKWCSKCMQDRNVLVFKLKLGQLFLRKIIKIIATRCHILKLKCIMPIIGSRRAAAAADHKHPARRRRQNSVGLGLYLQQ